jgi:hypothetical protein
MKANGGFRLVNMLPITLITIVSVMKAWKRIVGLFCIIFLLHETKLVNYNQCWVGMEK